MESEPLARRGADAGAFRALEEALDARVGLSLPPGDARSIEWRLRHRIRERALDGLTEYAEYLVHGAPDEAWVSLVETLTANESRVFGGVQDFLPLFELSAEPRWSLYARGPDGEPFRALCAGSGTGEEAYSVALALAEVSLRTPAFRFEVVGVDLSRGALAAARAGVYSAARFEALPPELRERHLAPAGEGRLAVGGLRRHTRFALANLSYPGSLRPLGGFDLVLARGVLEALTPRARRITLSNLAGTLRPGGILLLGPGEDLGGTDLGLLPVRWGDRHAYERPGPCPPVPAPPDERVPDPATALVAHRSPLLRRWLSLLLTRGGYSVETAGDGTEALTRAMYGRPRGLYWLERGLPPWGGEAVAARLIAMGAAEPERVRFLWPGPPQAEESLEAGISTGPIPLSQAEVPPPPAGAVA